MFINSRLMTPLSQRETKGLNPPAWEDNYYETYRLNYELPVVRLQRPRQYGGSWFSVDLYDVSIADYYSLMALINKKGKPCIIKHPNLDRYILRPHSIVNVGIAKEQGYHKGGGFQFELVSHFPKPYLLEHTKSPKRVRF